MDSDDGRGLVYYPERNLQVKDFSGLRYGKITPTDIDGFIDFGNKAFVYIELKYNGTEMKHGQKLANERYVDDHGKPTIGIIATHETAADESIDVANCTVSAIRYKRNWRPIRQRFTVRQVVDRFLRRYAPEYLDMATATGAPRPDTNKL